MRRFGQALLLPPRTCIPISPLVPVAIEPCPIVALRDLSLLDATACVPLPLGCNRVRERATCVRACREEFKTALQLHDSAAKDMPSNTALKVVFLASAIPFIGFG